MTTYTQCLIGDCNDGYGIMIYESGSSYDGFWKNGQPDSIGIKFHKNGEIQEGVWRNGVFIREKEISDELWMLSKVIAKNFNSAKSINDVKKKIQDSKYIGLTSKELQQKLDSTLAILQEKKNVDDEPARKKENFEIVEIGLSIIAGILGIVLTILQIKKEKSAPNRR